MNSSLKLFTQPDILQQIGVDSLQKFLNQFTDSNSGLSSLNSNSPYYTSELARVFTQPQSLSAPLRETLVLLESATSPEHDDRLAAIAQQRLPDLYVTEFHPLALALELWLAFPDDLRQFDASGRDAFHRVPNSSQEMGTQWNASLPGPRVQSAESVSGNPFHEPSNEHAAPTELAEGPRDIGSYRHGAPTELFQSVQNVQAPAEPLSSIQESINPAFQCSQIEIQNSKFKNPFDLLRSLLTRYVILPKHAAEALALWIVHTYAFELRDVTTYLALESPVRRCGKTTLLNILSRLVNRPLVAANVSPSALYRAIEELRPTLMIDEADTFLKPNDELIGILNAGYHRATAYVLRVASERSEKGAARNSRIEPMNPVGTRSTASPSSGDISDAVERVPTASGQNSKFENSSVRLTPPSDQSPITNHQSRLVRFSCWCPKIIARIGRLPETLADRCIVIRMQRKTPNDQCERLRDFDIVAVGKDLRQECAQFVEQHREAITSAKPAIPAALNDRAADIWEPLLAIADCAGGDWPQLAREAAVALSSDTRDNNPIGSLLLDIFTLFAASGQNRILTREIVEALNTQFTERPWMEGRKSQRSTEIWLSKQLRPFGICPRMFRNEGAVVRGYLREDFDEAFRRYIPAGELDTLSATAEKADSTEGNEENEGINHG